MRKANQYRDSYCGKLTKEDAGKTVKIAGWVENIRDHGGVIFVDIRDESGTIQTVSNDEEMFSHLNKECSITMTGKIRERSEDDINPRLKTGNIELVVDSLKVLGNCKNVLPFDVMTSKEVNEEVRLKHRYLDLRNEKVHNNIIFRSQVISFLREKMTSLGFTEIQTPILTVSSPEGARDYIVPSRKYHGKFYALPQAPQIFKQLLMVSGFDRYFQIARCFRDEDLRANRQPEFTQVDMEMSFVDSEEDVMAIAEGLIRKVFKETINYDLPENIRRITYKEAMDRFGSDKPDTRFGLELVDVSDIVKDCSFQVFTGTVANGGSVRLINAKGFASKLSRRDIDALGEYVKTYRAKGLAWMALKEEGLQSPIAKFLSEETVNSILGRANAEKGDILFFVADKNETVFASLGALRLHLA